MSLLSKPLTFIRMIQKEGVVQSSRFAKDWLDKKLFETQRIEFIWLDPEHAVAPKVIGNDEFKFLNSDELMKHVDEPVYDLDTDVINRLTTGKHFCYAAIDQGKLAAYSWYALDEVEPADCFNFGMKLPSGVAYMYKGFTHPDYRGKRLHGYLMVDILNRLKGVRYLVSSIDWLNTASIKSCQRIGYEMMGQGKTWKLNGSRKWSYPSKLIKRGIVFNKNSTIT